MPFKLPDDYWIEIPGGTFTMGLLPHEARELAEIAVAAERAEPPYFTPDWKGNSRMLDWEETLCNVDWLTRYLLTHYPAREVELAPFAIARRPVTNALYERFLSEVPELEPGSWRRIVDRDPDGTTHGIDHAAAEAFARWAGARLPFEAEWERAARGPERALELLDVTSEGVRDGRAGSSEVCLDPWREPPGLVRAEWHETTPGPGALCLRGSRLLPGRSIRTTVSREPATVAAYGVRLGSIRVIRADGRPVPTVDPPRHERALLEVRTFDLHVLRPALERLRTSDISDFHKIEIGMRNDLKSPDHDVGIEDVCYEVGTAIRGGGIENPNRGHDVRVGFEPDPAVAASRYNSGLVFVAASRETFCRIPIQHGVFVWSIGYRLAEDGEVRARHIAGYRMAFDGHIHRLWYQFRPGELDTPLRHITSDMIVAQVIAAFAFYDDHADADDSPF